MRFVYKAKRGLKETLEGVIETQNKEEAINTLVEKGLFPIKIEEVKIEFPPSKLIRRKRIKRRDIFFFIQKLATLCKAKVDLLTSLKILHNQVESRNLQKIILEIYDLTRGGKTFSESLKKFPHIFSPLIVNIIKSGEETGHLDIALEHINKFLSREDSLRSKILVALAYPIFLIIVGIVSIIILMSFVIPKLGVMFEESGKDLPFITKVVLGVSSFFETWGIWILILFCIFFLILWNKKEVFEKIKNFLKLNTPLIKKIAKNQELINFSYSLSLLFKSGVPPLKSLEIASSTVDDPQTKRELKKVYLDVSLGKTLSKSMEAVTTLPDFFIKMISLGEESGSLGEVLEEVAEAYTQEIEKNIGIITSLLEPLLILILGIILGGIVFSIFLPIFQITQMVH